MTKPQIDLRGFGLLVALHALLAHCLAIIGRAVPDGRWWPPDDATISVEWTLLGLFALSSYAMCATFATVRIQQKPSQRWPGLRPLVAASIVCLAAVQALALA